jgi:hypothetical protein
MEKYSPALNVRFGSQAAVPLRFNNYGVWRSAPGHKQTLTALKIQGKRNPQWRASFTSTRELKHLDRLVIDNPCKYCKPRANLQILIKTIGYQFALCAEWGGVAAITTDEPAETQETRGCLELGRGQLK